MAIPPLAHSPKTILVSPNACIWNRFTSNIPMPTLYSGDSVRKPKLSVIEVLMYNMAALLAGVAAGYDVRMSNVSPVHPTLQPQSILKEIAPLKPVMDVEFTSVVDNDRRFAHNTYHGPARHPRAALSSMSLIPDDRTTRRSDSPQHYYHPSTISTTSGLGSNFTTNTSAMLSSSLGSHTQPPTPSPRRKISVSSFTENLDYSEGGTPPPPRYFETRAPAAAYAPSLLNDGYPAAHRAGYFGSNYFPYRPEVNLAYERDCKSYPDYSYDSPMHQHPLPSYYDYTYEQQTRTPPPRVPQMGISAAGHRRTPSNLSNSSNVNQGFSLDHDELPELYDFNAMSIQPEPTREVYKGSPGINRMRDYENLPFFSASPHHQPPAAIPPRSPYSLNTTPHRDLSPLVTQERPASLSFEHGGSAAIASNGASSKLRSSLKKYYRVQNANGSATGTPTNPTPPDSLTSDDSSYMSAKEGSISSQHSRVRFSPESFLDVTSPGSHDYPNTVGHGSASVNGISRRVSRRHTSDTAS